MKNKSRLMISLYIVVFILVIVLILLFLFLYKTLTNNKEKNPKITYKKIVKKYDIKDIDTLYFDFKNYDITYLSTKESKLIIKQSGKANKMLIDKKKEKNKLTIKEPVSNIFDKKTYMIYIPNTYKGKIKIDNGFGNVSIMNLESIYLDNNSGNIKIKNISELIIKNVSGNVNITGELNKIKGTSTIGGITIEKLIGSCKIDTITGDVLIKNFLINSTSMISTTSGDISIKVDKKSDCKFLYYNRDENNITNKKCLNGKNELRLENVTGIINIR